MERNVWYNTYESRRIYYFPGETDLVIENPIHIKVTESGYHHLETSSGKKVVVTPGWLGIELYDGEWITEDDRSKEEDEDEKDETHEQEEE